MEALFLLGSPVSPSSVEAAPALGAWVAFGVLAALVLGGAIVTITRRNLINAVMALVATFFGVAGLYAMLSAHFLAAIQVLVYAGGIMVLFIFVVMVLNKEEAEPWTTKGVFGKILGGGAIAYLAIRLGYWMYVYARPIAPSTRMSLDKDFGSVAKMGNFLFTDFLFPFEAISILLVIAVLAAVVVARSPVAHATSVYELPTGETDARLPQHDELDEMVDVDRHAPQISPEGVS